MPEIEKKSRFQEIQFADNGAQLKTGDDAWGMALAIKAAKMAPTGMDEHQILIAIQMGLEVGLPPMTALRNIAVINGRPTIWGDTLLALVERSGKLEDMLEEVTGEGDQMVATCTIKRKGRPTPIVRTFSATEAIKAGLWSKDIWKKYSRRMLAMRARAFAIRDAFPDALGGFLLREEAEDHTPLPAEATTGSQGLLNALTKPEDDAIDVESRPAEEPPAEPQPDDGERTPSPEELAAIEAREAEEARLFEAGQ